MPALRRHGASCARRCSAPSACPTGAATPSGGALAPDAAERLSDERSRRPARGRSGSGSSAPGQYLCFEADGELRTVALTREWTRIGRSLAADLRFDDPTVSRRHALVVRQADGVRMLDDRSLNGVFVNGARVEGQDARRRRRDRDRPPPPELPRRRRLTAPRRRRPGARTASSARSPSRRPRPRGPAATAPGLLVEAPHEHRRAGARDRRAQRPELASARGELDRSAGTARARRCSCRRSCRPRATRSQSPLARPSVSSARVGDVEDRLGERHLRGSAARAARVCTASSGTTASASRPVGASKRVARPSAHTTKPPYSAAATLSGWPSSSLACASRSASSSNRWSAASSPATIAAALEPRPPTSGISERILNVKPSAGRRRSNARTQRFSRPRLTADRSRRRSCPVSSTSSSRCRASAAAMQSKPGPEVRRGGGDADQAPTDHRAPLPRSRASRRRRGSPGRRCGRSPSRGPSGRGRSARRRSARRLRRRT